MSLLDRVARAHNVANIAQAPEHLRVTIFHEAVDALDRVLDGDQPKITETSLKVFTQDLNRIIEGIRSVNASLFQSQDGLLSHLRESRRLLFAAHSMLQSGTRKNLTFFRHLDQARACLEQAGHMF